MTNRGEISDFFLTTENNNNNGIQNPLKAILNSVVQAKWQSFLFGRRTFTRIGTETRVLSRKLLRRERAHARQQLSFVVFDFVSKRHKIRTPKNPFFPLWQRLKQLLSNIGFVLGCLRVFASLYVTVLSTFIYLFVINGGFLSLKMQRTEKNAAVFFDCIYKYGVRYVVWLPW